MSIKERSEMVASIQFPNLPIIKCFDEIQRAMISKNVVIIAGDTGSGKSTQLPKFLFSIGRGHTKRIAHTQPRRVAVQTLASRIAREMGPDLCEVVGFHVRFLRKVSYRTRIKIVTDGLLLAEIKTDPLLNSYDTIIIDEVHERNLNIDLLLGFLKKILLKRNDLKVFITSATLNTKIFSEYFFEAPIIQIDGKTFPVSISYQPVNVDINKVSTNLSPLIFNQIIKCRKNDQGLKKHSRGILVFLPGERTILDVSRYLRRFDFEDLEVLPIYGRLSSNEQQKVMIPPKKGIQRVVLATNIAETSLTIPGIFWVIDSGLVRVNRYSAASRFNKLLVEFNSKASANQRAGRAGREGPGKCIRLFSENEFNERFEFSDPEILRTNLTYVILQFLFLNLGDINNFPFLAAPRKTQIKNGISELKDLGAIDSKGNLTEFGAKMAQLPLDPCLSRVLLESFGREVFSAVSVICAFLSIPDPRLSSKKIQHCDSEFISIIELWQVIDKVRQDQSEEDFKNWCITSNICYQRLQEWRLVHRQIKIFFKGKNFSKSIPVLTPKYKKQIHICLITGLVFNVGKKHGDEYIGLRNRHFSFKSKNNKTNPTWILAAEIKQTQKLTATTVASIKSSWIIEAVPHLIKFIYGDMFWSRRQGKVMCYRETCLHSFVLRSKEAVSFFSENFSLARRLFIEEALVNERINTHVEFLKKNRIVRIYCKELEKKIRKMDIFFDTLEIADLYDSLLPDKVYDQKSLSLWLGGATSKNSQALIFKSSDLLKNKNFKFNEALYPTKLQFENLSFPLEYRFQSGENDDGINIRIPLSIVNKIKKESFEGIIPGYLSEKILYFCKMLPKDVRKKITPVKAFADFITNHINWRSENFTEELYEAIENQIGCSINRTYFNHDKLPSWLRYRIIIFNKDLKIVGASRDFGSLKNSISSSDFVDDENFNRKKSFLSKWPSDSLEFPSIKLDGHIKLREYKRLKTMNGRVIPVGVFYPNDCLHKMEHDEATRTLILIQLKKELNYLKRKGSSYIRLLVKLNLGQKDLFLFHLLIVNRIHPNSMSQILNQEQFDRCLNCVRQDFVNEAESVSSSLLISFNLLNELRKKLLSDYPPNWSASIKSMLEQIKFLTENFITPISSDRFLDLERYARGIQKRLDKLPTRLILDLKWQNQIDKLNNLLGHHCFDNKNNWRLVDEKLVDLKWQIEEFKLTCFAPALRNSEKISYKALKEKIASVKCGN